MKRAFVALDLPEAVTAQLDAARVGLPAGARRVPIDHLHLTLRFFGNVEDARFVSLRSALDHVVHPPLRLTLSAPGTFPAEGMPHVLWMGMAPSDALVSLRARIDEAAQAIGLASDERAFTPHVTLARLRDVPRSALDGALGALSAVDPVEIAISAFTLYTSALTHDGATHTVMRRYALGTPSATPA